MRMPLLLRWGGLAALVGMADGLGSAGFLVALAWVTERHQARPWLLFGLPLAGALMGVELFGSAVLVPITITTFVAYLASGHRGIYAAQRIHTPKFTIDGGDLVGSRLDAVRPRAGRRL